jgi:beta-galactosidase
MFHFGVDYYPEQWPEERWQIDVQLMAEAGFNTIRLAEFAWARMEPEEGLFDFDWLDRAIDVFQRRGIAVILGTPTASFPPWLAEKSAEVLRVREDGLRVGYGARRMNCPSHPTYRWHSRAITAAMADHFATNPAVIGWQIDNEFGDRCFCATCRKAFQSWLQQRYGTLDELNRRWGTVFWSQIYSKWEQIPLPSANAGAPPNPSLALEFRRFASDTYASFQQEQIDILRAKCPRHFITHDMMGFEYGGLDYFDLAKPLDLVSWNDYPYGFWHKLRQEPALPALNHDAMRGLKRKNFWVMEQQAGPTGWETVSAAPRPGALRLWAYQSIAHGADGVIFFRWRTARFGAEQYWHGLLESDGRAGRRYQEIKQMGGELKRVSERIAGAVSRSRVAILQSYDARFAFQVQANSDDFSYEKHIAQIHAALWRLNIGVDVISPLADLSCYDLVIAPALHIVTDEIDSNIRNFVRSGGTLVVTPRTGVKDVDNVLIERPLPGSLAEVCGVIVDEYDPLSLDTGQSVVFEAGELAGLTQPVHTWCDILLPHGAEVLARYGHEYYTDKPAVTRHTFGKGQAIYLGAFGTDALYDAILGWLLSEKGLRCSFALPEGVEMTERWQGEERLIFLLNHSGRAQAISLDKRHVDLLTDSICQGQIELDAHDVLLLQEYKV